MPSNEQQPARPTHYFTVDPDKIHQAKKDFEQEATNIKQLLDKVQDDLQTVPSMGEDPRSKLVAKQLSANGESAIKAVEAYANVLNNIVIQLQATIDAYELTEQENVDRYDGGPA